MLEILMKQFMPADFDVEKLTKTGTDLLRKIDEMHDMNTILMAQFDFLAGEVESIKLELVKLNKRGVENGQ